MLNKKKVLLGLSGGVDSSVAALILKKQGYYVIGAFMKNFSDTKNKITGECAWREERRIAQKIAIKIGIPLITLDFEKDYKNKVIRPLFEGYSKGKTPNPDLLCNKIIKFPLLWNEAKKIGANYISTGHYARIKKNKEGFKLLTGKDPEKDQSYFLASLSQNDLSHTLFPLGKMNKKRVRKIAKENDFSNWNKQGSRGICFVGKMDLKSFLSQKIKEKPGKIISPEGKTIGKHPGIYYYTIGQKVGEHFDLKIIKPKEHSQKKWFIAEKRKNNTIVAAPEGHQILFKKEVNVKNIHIINPKEKIPKDIKVRFRHRGDLKKGKLVIEKNRSLFTFDKPQTGLAEGQYLVFYHKDEVIGCGEISF